MKVRVKYLMWLADIAGTSEEVIEVPEKATIASLLKVLTSQRPAIANHVRDLLQGKSEIIVLHNSMTPLNGLNTPLSEHDVITLIPPVSGGRI